MRDTDTDIGIEFVEDDFVADPALWAWLTEWRSNAENSVTVLRRRVAGKHDALIVKARQGAHRRNHSLPVPRRRLSMHVASVLRSWAGTLEEE